MSEQSFGPSETMPETEAQRIEAALAAFNNLLLWLAPKNSEDESMGGMYDPDDPEDPRAALVRGMRDGTLGSNLSTEDAELQRSLFIEAQASIAAVQVAERLQTEDLCYDPLDDNFDFEEFQKLQQERVEELRAEELTAVQALYDYLVAHGQPVKTLCT